MAHNHNAETLAEQGKQAYQKNNLTAAAQFFSQAAEAFTQSNDALMAAEMCNNLSVVLVQQGQAREALQAVQGTPQIFAEAGDVRRQGIAVGNEAAAYEALGNIEQSVSLYQQSAALLEQAGEKMVRGQVLRALANLQARRGNLTGAVQSTLADLAETEKPTLTQRLLKFLLRFKRW